jgi:AAA ATPase domain
MLPACPPAPADPSGDDVMSGQQTKAPLLGRDEELAAVLAALDEAAAGDGSLILLGGEPGIGKSRLADEVSSHARQRGIASLWGRGWEDAGAPPYWPWVQVLRSHLRQTDPDVARRHLAPGAADLVQMLPGLRELLPDLPAESRPESDAARFQLFDSTASFFRNAARDRPSWSSWTTSRRPIRRPWLCSASCPARSARCASSCSERTATRISCRATR